MMTDWWGLWWGVWWGVDETPHHREGRYTGRSAAVWWGVALILQENLYRDGSQLWEMVSQCVRDGLWGSHQSSLMWSEYISDVVRNHLWWGQETPFATYLLLRRKEASPPTLPHVCCCDADDSVASYGWFVFLQKCMHFSFFGKKLGAIGGNSVIFCTFACRITLLTIRTWTFSPSE